ncbi:hypothetical protein JR316_0012423 [Psilocybe cubensis]|uniref:Uncharacterized protein n=1 Tax=Psilocybe cubensis TaxID=181762 RepID=A0ACB8GIV7_PSICU|nr:hypothetical protein JR316_0012423 [Psilocybe cubensis]KAH9475312.1 hypothetical protein JR316_0012423 [Psilocybe cubensis]
MELENESYLFKPARPDQQVAVLLLIENSPAMSQHWPYLRDTCLDTLAAKLEHANNSALITVSVLESYPCHSPSPNPSLPRQCHGGFREGINTVQFNPIPENSISAGHISSCIDTLNQQNFRVSLPALHLIIVAANMPSDDDYGVPWAGHGYSSPWVYLANEMRAAGGRIGLPRRNSYPLPDNFCREVFDEATGAPVSNEPDQPQSLVSQLQQYHGLTKKKVYGTKPTRQPFFRDERVEKHRQLPAPLIMPLAVMNSVPSPTSGGRPLSHSRIDRMNRVSQASPTDMHRRQYSGWPRRGSRMSTPEADHSWTTPPSHTDMSPGGSYTTSDLSATVTPIVPIDDVYGHQSAPVTLPSPPTHVMPGTGVYGATGRAEMNWSTPPMQPPQGPQQYVNHYTPGLPSYIPAEMPHYGYSDNSQPSYSVERVTGAMAAPSELARASNLAPRTTHPPMPLSPPNTVPPQGHHVASGASPSAIPPLPQPPVHAPPPQPSGHVERTSPTVANNVPRPTSSNKKTFEDENDERFSFSEEFVVATAHLFNTEVLPSYPDYPGSSSGLLSPSASEQILPPPPVPQAGELYASRDQSYVHSRANSRSGAAVASHSHGHVRATPYVPMSSSTINNDASLYALGAPHYAAQNYGSSLTGWAG